jgi:hypothetical protein
MIKETTSTPRRAASTGDDAALTTLLSLAAAGAGAGSVYGGLKRELKEAVASDPFDATVVTVLGGSYLFYLAEKGKNPKVATYWDALVFISTCLSVGYADVFARTPAGKAIASAMMTVGPAMSGALFEGPSGPQAAAAGAAAAPEVLEVQRAIAGKLDAILAELRGGRGGG